MTTTSILAAARARCGGAPVLAVVVLAVVAALAPAVSAEVSSSSSKESKDLLTTNHQLLSGLGLARLPGHGQGMLPNKKVPATEDDSRVFVVRLPPSQHYYSLLKSPPSLANSVSKQVEVGFRSNGKPARVYHWNIPVLKKMAAARRRSTQGNGSQPKPAKNPSKSKLGATRRKAAAYHRVQQQQLKAKQQQQQLHQQQLQQHQQLEAGPEPAGPSPYYYVPAKKTSMHKLLGGNGKPHAMYVLEKSRTPAYFQRLLP